MQRARWTRPSCLVMLGMLALLLAAFVWLVSGQALRTPAPTAVPKASPTYDTDVPSQDKPASGR